MLRENSSFKTGLQVLIAAAVVSLLACSKQGDGDQLGSSSVGDARITLIDRNGKLFLCLTNEGKRHLLLYSRPVVSIYSNGTLKGFCKSGNPVAGLRSDSGQKTANVTIFELCGLPEGAQVCLPLGSTSQIRNIAQGNEVDLVVAWDSREYPREARARLAQMRVSTHAPVVLSTTVSVRMSEP